MQYKPQDGSYGNLFFKTFVKKRDLDSGKVGSETVIGIVSLVHFIRRNTVTHIFSI